MYHDNECVSYYNVQRVIAYLLYFYMLAGTNNHKAVFRFIEEQLEKRYPGHILPKEHREWIFVNAGGWIGSMYVLHASLTEYLLFFGTAIDTSGHSGQSVVSS